MTIRFTESTISDKFLALLGKKRAVYISKDIYKTLGVFVYAKAPRESFWRALLRNKNQSPPSGWIYVE